MLPNRLVDGCRFALLINLNKKLYIMENVHFYEVNVEWKENRFGVMQSPVLNHSLEVATPPEFAGGMPGIWSPEHLLVAAVNSCLMTTFLAIAENFKLPFEKFNSHANGKLEKVDGKFMISEIELTPELIITNEADKEKAERVLIKSEAACLISNSVKAKIIFTPKVVVQPIAELV
jgi:peroxiredoxin-like protein